MNHHEKSIKRQRWSFLEKIFTVIVLFLATGAIFPLLRESSGISYNPVHGDIVMQAAWVCIYLITFLLIARGPGRAALIASQDKFLFVLVLLAISSCFWSDHPAVTLRSSLALMGTTAFGVYLVSRFTTEELLKLLLWTLGASAVLSVLFALVTPWYGIQHDFWGFPWRGVYLNKNTLGGFMALAFIVSLLYMFTNCWKRIFAGLVLCGVSAALILLSKSAASLIIALIVLFTLPACLIMRRSLIWGMVIFMVLLSAGTIAVWWDNNFYAVLSALGREPSLTGRTELWLKLWPMVLQNPALGYGYNAFWLGWDGASREIWSLLKWKPAFGHNGYLDLVLNLGFAGLFFFSLSLFNSTKKALVLMKDKGNLTALFSIVYIVFLLTYNTVESFILLRNSLFWILYVFIALKPGFEHNELRNKTAQGDC